MRFKGIDKRLFTILMVVFVQMVGASMVLPILPLFAQRRFDMSPRVITLLITVFFAAQFVAGPYLGRLSDRYGRVPVLIISQIGTAISFAMIGFADSVSVLFIARILDGITGGNIIVAQAYVTDITTKEDRTQSLGYIFAVFGLGFIIGPAVGGLLSAAFDIQTPFIFAAIAAGAIVILTRVTLEETVTKEKRIANKAMNSDALKPRAVMANYPLLMVLFIAFVGQFGLGLLQATFALYGESVLFKGASEDTQSVGIGLLLASIGLGQLLTQIFILKRAARRFGEAKLVVMGTLLRGISLFIYALISSPLLAGFNGLFFALGTGIMIPPSQSIATSTVDDELRGGVLGLYQSARNLAIIFGTAIAGTLFEISPRMPYWIGGILFMIALIPGFYLLKWLRFNVIQPTRSFIAPIRQ